jgi:hypothetical protein
MAHDCGEVYATFKSRGRAPVFELVGRTGTALTQWCRLFDPLFPLNSTAVTPFRKALIGSISALWWSNTVKYLWRLRAGVVLSQLRIGLLKSVLSESISGLRLTFGHIDDLNLKSRVVSPHSG